MSARALTHAEEKIMSSLSQSGALAVLCLLCTQAAHGQSPECGGDYVCIADDPAAVIAWAEKRGPELRVHLRFDPAASMNLQRFLGPQRVSRAVPTRTLIDVRRAAAARASRTGLASFARCSFLSELPPDSHRCR